MDESVWLSHADPWKPLDMLGLPREVWREYADLTRAAARGYWHGESGVLAERLKIGKRQWLKASRAWHPRGWVPDKIGDTCFGVFQAIVSRALEGDKEADRWLGRIREVCETPQPKCLSISADEAHRPASKHTN